MFLASASRAAIAAPSDVCSQPLYRRVTGACRYRRQPNSSPMTMLQVGAEGRALSAVTGSDEAIPLSLGGLSKGPNLRRMRGLQVRRRGGIEATQPHLGIDQHPHRRKAFALAGAEPFDRAVQRRAVGIGAHVSIRLGEKIEIAAQAALIGEPVVVRQPQPDLAPVDNLRIEKTRGDALEQRLGFAAGRANAVRQAV